MTLVASSRKLPMPPLVWLLLALIVAGASSHGPKWCCPFSENEIGSDCQTTECQQAELEAYRDVVRSCEHCQWLRKTASDAEIVRFACFLSFEACGWGGMLQDHAILRAALQYVNTGACVASGGHAPIKSGDYCVW